MLRNIYRIVLIYMTRMIRTVQNSLKFVSSPLVEEEEGEEDTLLELTFSPQQTGTTIPSSTYVSHK